MRTFARLRVAIVAAGLLMAGLALPTAAVADPPDIDSRLVAGQTLTTGGRITSPSGNYYLVMQADGNLVEYTSGGTAVWASFTFGSGFRAAMQADGNFVVYNSANQPQWWTRTNGDPGSLLRIQDDGNLVVYQAGTAKWARMDLAPALGDNYPSNLRKLATNSKMDPWLFGVRECTSFVAWRINSANGVAFSDHMSGKVWGDAASWKSTAIALGYPVNNIPATGAIAWYSYGHVAWVARVNDNNTVLIEQYNIGGRGAYSQATVPTSSISYFIHIRDL